MTTKIPVPPGMGLKLNKILPLMQNNALMAGHFENMLRDNEALGAWYICKFPPTTVVHIKKYYDRYKPVTPRNLKKPVEGAIARGRDLNAQQLNALIAALTDWATTKVELGFKVFNKPANDHYELFMMDIATNRIMKLKRAPVDAVFIGPDRQIVQKPKVKKQLDKAIRAAAMANRTACDKEVTELLKVIAKDKTNSKTKYSVKMISDAIYKALP
ncbi:hypothetical protein [uncultured Roseobacter sp.]|uniref:hypothetical protein n=1 Tax=uncultured Roseobacter sp. TaxID=114847 RepID=UPI002616D882|nr:hypothetical protein [uncultured Roseobacter sp.]